MALTCSDIYFRKPAPELSEKRLAKKKLFDFINNVTCGFELECQSLHGKTTRDYNIQRGSFRELDMEAFERAKLDAYEELRLFPLCNHAIMSRALPEISQTMKVAFIKNKYPRQYAELKPSNLTDDRLRGIAEIRGTKVSDLLNYLQQANLGSTRHNKYKKVKEILLKMITGEIRSSLQDTELFVDKTRFYSDDPPIYDMKQYFEYQAERRFPELVELVPDGSVAGPEIRTIGGLTVVDFLKTAKEVLKKNMKVDKGCSFHIHVGIAMDPKTGSQHRISGEVQLYAFEYLLRHVHEFSPEIRERIARNQRDGRKYYKFSPNLRQDRYFCVAVRQNTYEFRLWGNICDYKNIAKALMFTIKALHYGLRVVYGNEIPVFKNIDDLKDSYDFRQVINRYLDSEDFYAKQMPFEVYIRKNLIAGTRLEEEAERIIPAPQRRETVNSWGQTMQNDTNFDSTSTTIYASDATATYTSDGNIRFNLDNSGLTVNGITLAS